MWTLGPRYPKSVRVWSWTQCFKYILSENVNKLMKSSPGPISLFHRGKFLKKIKTKKDRCIKKTGMKTQVFKAPGAEVLLRRVVTVKVLTFGFSEKMSVQKNPSIFLCGTP